MRNHFGKAAIFQWFLAVTCTDSVVLRAEKSCDLSSSQGFGVLLVSVVVLETTRRVGLEFTANDKLC